MTTTRQSRYPVHLTVSLVHMDRRDKDNGVLQRESSSTSVSKKALPIAPENQSNVDAMNGETNVSQPLKDQKSSAVPSDMVNDVATQHDTPGNGPATEPQPSTSSTGLIQINTPTIITNPVEFGGIGIDLDVR